MNFVAATLATMLGLLICFGMWRVFEASTQRGRIPRSRLSQDELDALVGPTVPRQFSCGGPHGLLSGVVEAASQSDDARGLGKGGLAVGLTILAVTIAAAGTVIVHATVPEAEILSTFTSLAVVTVALGRLAAAATSRHKWRIQRGLEVRAAREALAAAGPSAQPGAAAWMLGLGLIASLGCIAGLGFAGPQFGAPWTAVLTIVLATLGLNSLVALIVVRHRIRLQFDRTLRLALQDFNNLGSTPYVLYLRPFSVDLALVAGADTTRGGLWTRRERAFMLEEELGARCLQLNVLLRSIGPKQGQRGPVATETSDREWRDAFTKLVARATLILVIPNPSVGSTWEIGRLLNDQATLRRCLWIMPPASMAFHRDRLATAWGAVCTQFQDDWKTPFPQWTSAGALFCYDEDDGRLRVTIRNFSWALISQAVRSQLPAMGTARSGG